MKVALATFTFQLGYISDIPLTSGAGYLHTGSLNAMMTGSGEVRAFKGTTAVPTITGSKQFFLVDGGNAGLGEYNTTGSGSVFKAQDLLLFIGQGILKVNGVSSTRSASTSLSYLQRTGGVFSSSSPYFAVGHARPSAPTVYAKSPSSSGVRPMSAAVSVVIWRICSVTSQTSLYSPTSVVVTVTNGSIIVQFPAVDANNQDYWGIGVPKLGERDLGAFYELPTELGGEVAESVLAYTRSVNSGTLSSGTNVLNSTPAAGQDFTTADIGRRIYIGAFTSWITGVNSTSQVTLNDTAGSSYSGTITVKQAVDGIERAVEISWSDFDLAGQDLAPDQAFEPPEGLFAGSLFDTFYVEDLEGSIFYSIPNSLSFPRSRIIFTDEAATCIIDAGDNTHWRIGKQTIGKLTYVGGERPIDFSLRVENIGCKYPQNACIGYNGRLMVWTGRPTLIENSTIDSSFYTNVAREFEGWEAQTAAKPVVAAYDPHNQYELWIWGEKVMAMHAPTGRWCSPINLTALSGDVVSAIVANERLIVTEKLVSSLKEWQFDVGTGTTMTLYSHHQKMPLQQVTTSELTSTVRVTSTSASYQFTLIKNFIKNITRPAFTFSSAAIETQQVLASRPNIRGVKHLGIKATITPADGYASIEDIIIYGDVSQDFTR